MRDDDQLPAWQTIIELAEAGVAANLVLVGGLMVHVHAARGGIIAPRSTSDADFLVDFLSNRSSLHAVYGALGKLGFRLDADGTYAYRFIHADGRKVDIMVPDHMPDAAARAARLSRRPVLRGEAGEQAIRRRDVYRVTFDSGTVIELAVPDELGAVVAKGAAYLVDSRDHDRHLSDAATLLASIADVSEISFDTISKNDKRRVRALHALLKDATHPGWASLDADARNRGQFNLSLFADQMEL
ncbi:hypothetical protein [Gryllotalpicola ginsengisoli]|uniref:hypothetical protein n=1 Tax=Gryllotalpicola ginsengisoli TaxID=444608 RepID=UPI0003B2F7F3|nr:hypothetical protein [Gryllotalpicola ginsengisoli]